jgi:hypothetical protein
MIRDYLRTLAVATMALSVLALPGAHSYGKNQHPNDDGVRCSRYDHDGNLDFFMPGQTTPVTNGNGVDLTLECGSDGNWTLAKPTQTSGNGQTSTGSTRQMP